MLDFTSNLDQDTITLQEPAPVQGPLHTGVVMVGMSFLSSPNKPDLIVPVTANGKRAELFFIGARGDLYHQTVLAYLAAVEAVGGVAELPLTVWGTWSKRTWTKRSGEDTFTWRLTVSHWSWTQSTQTRTAGLAA